MIKENLIEKLLDKTKLDDQWSHITKIKDVKDLKSENI
jgi:hypothetical protein